MRSNPVVPGWLLALLLSILPGGCGDDSPGAPSPLPSQPTSLTVGLELSGPESVPPGGTAQFRAIDHRGDGSSRDVTEEAAWRGGNPAILTVSSTGVVSGQQPGETSLSVSYLNRTATRNQVFVLPPGTYKVSGVVRDASHAVSGARVAVTTGSGQGLSTTTADGIYRLYGVGGPTELQVTKTGYLDEKRHVEVTRHETADFDLRLVAPRPEISGTYTLRISAANHCDSLPDDVRTRTYTALLEQTGPGVTTTLSGPTFLMGAGRVLNRFYGTVEPARVTFQVTAPSTYYYWYVYTYPSVLEQLTASGSYSFSGSVQAAASGSRISGTLDGVVGTYDLRLAATAFCRSSSHQFVLSK
jgi:hypothetical protein